MIRDTLTQLIKVSYAYSQTVEKVVDANNSAQRALDSDGDYMGAFKDLARLSLEAAEYERALTQCALDLINAIDRGGIERAPSFEALIEMIKD